MTRKKPLGGPTLKTVKRLFATSGNQCAYPNCEVPVDDPHTGAILVDICHIKGQKPGAARYDPSQTAEERHGFDNLLLLCKNHHKVVDDAPGAFSVEYLQKLKREHAAKHPVGIEPSDEIAHAL